MEGGVGGDRGTCLVDHDALHFDLARHDERPGQAAGGREAPLDEQLVQTHPGNLGHRRPYAMRPAATSCSARSATAAPVKPTSR